MTNKALSIFNQLRPVSIGFDNVFDHFEKMFEDDFLSPMIPNYPPYNIVKTGKNKYDIEVALAGYSKKDIKVDYEDGLLTIKSAEKIKDESKEITYAKDGNILHKGIARRSFTKSFTVADDCEIKGAELKDGLLRVSMEKIVPEGRKARTIDVK